MSAKTENSAGAVRALVVDDHADTLKMMRLLLAQMGVVVVSSAGTAGAARVELERAGPVDVAFVDRLLGDGDGLQLVAEIRGACGCKVVIVTGEEPPADGPPPWVDGWLVKPVDLAKLRAMVESVRAG